jgi:hypothetical protein
MKKGILFFGIAAVAAFFVMTAAGMVAAAGISTMPTAAPTMDPQVLADFQARDQVARDLIQKANEQILSATATIDSTQLPNPTKAQFPITPPWPISPEAAVAIVHLVAPGATITAPAALVDFQGVTAYEINTNLGPVYIDAATGKVLFNGAARIYQYAPPASGGGARSSERDDHSEHDEGRE